MLDTLMVFLMQGFRTPRRRLLIAVLLVCTILGITCLLLIKWPHKIATTPVTANADPTPVVTPTTPNSSIPIILQNPCVILPTPTAKNIPRPRRIHTFYRSRQPAPLPTNPINSATQEQSASPSNGSFDLWPPKPFFTGFSAQNPPASCLNNNLATSANWAALSTLGPRFGELLAVVGGLLVCSLGLWVLKSRRTRLRV